MLHQQANFAKWLAERNEKNSKLVPGCTACQFVMSCFEKQISPQDKHDSFPIVMN